MIVAVHQPMYLPWLGWLSKVNAADVLVVLDTVQMKSRGPQRRATYPSNGKGRYLSLSVSGGRCSFRAATVDPASTAKHEKTLAHTYGANNYIASSGVLTREYDSLAALAIATMLRTLAVYDVDTRVVCASDLGEIDFTKSELLAELVQRVGGTTYLSGQGAGSYMDYEPFEARGLSTTMSTFEHPEYPQGGHPFVPGCMAMDWWMRDGNAAVRWLHAS